MDSQAEITGARAMRRSRHYTQKTADHGQITDAVPISQRPPTAEDRALPGHWEGDLLCGTTRSQIATLVERKSQMAGDFVSSCAHLAIRQMLCCAVR